MNRALTFLRQHWVRYEISIVLLHLTPVPLGSKDAPYELMVHSTEGRLVEECCHIGVAIVVMDLLMDSLLSPHLTHGCWT